MDSILVFDDFKHCFRELDTSNYNDYLVVGSVFFTIFSIPVGLLLGFLIAKYGFNWLVEQGNLVSVSYTHLDVYKRQEYIQGIKEYENTNVEQPAVDTSEYLYDIDFSDVVGQESIKRGMEIRCV